MADLDFGSNEHFNENPIMEISFKRRKKSPKNDCWLGQHLLSHILFCGISDTWDPQLNSVTGVLELGPYILGGKESFVVVFVPCIESTYM
ncbi:unnamed protein product [Allacma fusca]|uniref:Uncharacterized protein n=1 Tax=Allacma fusca TaxID=39272 RepID=A0A8J2PHV2_9HEXA|nr:unnamed protein product [Allacma fusca]